MPSSPTNTTTFIVSLAAIAAAFALGWGVANRRQLNAPPPQTVTLPTKALVTPAIPDLAKVLPLPVPSVPAEAVRPVPPTPGAQLAAQYANNPALRERLAGLKRGQIEQRYAPLLKNWALPAEQRQAMLDLLVESDLADTDLAMRLMGAGPEEKARLLSELNQLKVGLDGRLQVALGPQHYAEYHDFTALLPLRAQVDTLAQRLSRTADPLGSEQAESLVRVLSSSRAATNALGAGMDGTIPPVLDQAGMDAMLQTMHQANEMTVASAAAVLSPAQLAVFRQIQDERMAGTKRGLDLIR